MLKAILSYAGFGSALSGVIKAAVVKSIGGTAYTEAVQIVANADGLTLSGANAEITVHLHVPASILGDGVEIIEEGTVIVPAKVLDSILKKMPGLIEFSEESNDQLFLSSGKTKFNMPTLEQSSTWLRNATPSQKVTVNGKDLKHALSGVLFAVNKSDARPILTGVHFLPDGNGGTVVEATNGVALGRVMLKDVEIPECIVPGDTIKSILSTLSDDDMTIGLETAYLVIEDGPNKMDLRLLDGRFPDTSKIVNVGDYASIEIGTAELKAALERCAVIAMDDNHSVLVTVKDGVCYLLAQEQGFKNVEEIPVVSQNGEIEIAFNTTLFVNALKNMGKTATVIFGGTNRPCSITTSEDDSVFALVAPVLRR